MEAYALTDVGRVRECNQDYIYSSSDPVGCLDNLLLVADGMGGHNAGDYASRFMVEELNHYVKAREEGLPVQVLKDGICQVNRQLYRKSLENPVLSGMGTTLVAATTQDKTLYAANVGDSRLYLFREGALRQVTRDHSFVEEMVAKGQMERYSKDYQRRKNIITRALGIMDRVEVDFFEEELLHGDLLLLCSDGLSNMITDEEMALILSEHGSLKYKVEKLASQANEHGGYDNIAVIVADPQISEVRPC
ncbi:MAG: Stp1/IreP family PP2C-type Ser/Thr phosphatase [Hungatella sp.]|nr:Stp1/IreP family PP2C-type Ser/Thr phosphatase [Hungatella sp.]